MAYNLFLDTNIIIDFLDPRRPFHRESNVLFKMLEERRFKAFYSESVVTTTAYVIRKDFSKRDISEIIGHLNKRITLLTCSAEYIKNVAVMLPPDFEDALLYEIAMHHQMDYFITSNIKDFKSIQKNILPVMTARDFNKLLPASELE